MKKLFLTVTLLLGMTLGAFADGTPYESTFFLFNLFNPEDEEEESTGLFENDEINELMWDNVVSAPSGNVNYEGGGLFGRGKSMYTGVGGGFKTGGAGLLLPPQHGSANDETPLGSGVVVLLGMGAAYLVAKRRKE